MVSDLIKLIENGEIGEALKKVKDMKEDSKLEIIALYLIEKGYHEEAAKIAEKISSSGLRDEILRKIAVSYIEHGNIEKAINLTKKIKTETDLEKIAKKLIEIGRYRDALKVAEKIRSRAIKEEVLVSIIDALLWELNK